MLIVSKDLSEDVVYDLTNIIMITWEQMQSPLLLERSRIGTKWQRD